MKLFNIQKLLIGLFFAALLTACDENSSKKAGLEAAKAAAEEAVKAALAEAAKNMAEAFRCAKEALTTTVGDLQSIGLSGERVQHILFADKEARKKDLKRLPAECQQSSLPEDTEQKCLNQHFSLTCQDAANELEGKTAEEKAAITAKCKSILYALEPAILKCEADHNSNL